MKIIILSAGKGERLMPLTKNTPKPLLYMGDGKTLIEEQIERIQLSKVINEIVFIIGYLADQIEAKVQMYLDNGVIIRTIFNPFYEMSNNLMSLWLAKHEMKEDFLISNGDCIFSSNIYTDLLNGCRNGIFLCTNRKEIYDDDDMKVVLDGDMVVKVSKDIDKPCAESPGLALVRGPKFRKIFVEKMERLARNRNYLNKFWLEIFNCIASDGVPVFSWPFNENAKWQEVDFHMDVEHAKRLLRIQDV